MAAGQVSIIGQSAQCIFLLPSLDTTDIFLNVGTGHDYKIFVVQSIVMILIMAWLS